MFTIVSTRYNDTTWQENITYRKKTNHNGCIYGAPHMLSNKIVVDSLVFVVEMNNSINQIEGIGFVKNNLRLDKSYKIYDSGNYNRYVFKGKFHITREQLIEINGFLVECLDYILFKKKSHMKRGMGFTTIPEKLLKDEICKGMDLKEEIKTIFIRLFSS
jgi:hypothetical protein